MTQLNKKFVHNKFDICAIPSTIKKGQYTKFLKTVEKRKQVQKFKECKPANIQKYEEILVKEQMDDAFTIRDISTQGKNTFI